MPSETKIQDPADKLDYLIDWLETKNGLAPGETITVSTWAPYDDKWAPTTHLIPDDDLHSNTDTEVIGWTAIAPSAIRGKKYYFTNHIVTNQGRELSWSITIKVKEQ